MAASPPEVDAVAVLASAPMQVLGLLPRASNATLLVRLDTHAPDEPTGGRAGTAGRAGDGVLAVYKPQRGERPLWDFPEGTLHRREVAAWRVSDFLGWALVPPTVLRADAAFGPGSVQQFIEHDPGEHYFSLVEVAEHRPWLLRLALFDLVVNNADRKSGHVLLGRDGRLHAIDHGVTFAVEPKLRTVVWELGGTPVPADDRAQLVALAAQVEQASDPLGLAGLVSSSERSALAQRARRAARYERYPEVDEDRRSYPWPPI